MSLLTAKVVQCSGCKLAVMLNWDGVVVWIRCDWDVLEPVAMVLCPACVTKKGWGGQS